MALPKQILVFVVFLIMGFAYSTALAAQGLPKDVNCKGLRRPPLSKGCEKAKPAKHRPATQGNIVACSKNVKWSRDWHQVLDQMGRERASLPRIYEIGLCSGLELFPPVHKFIETDGRMNFYDPVTGELVHSVHYDILPSF